MFPCLEPSPEHSFATLSLVMVSWRHMSFNTNNAACYSNPWHQSIKSSNTFLIISTLSDTSLIAFSSSLIFCKLILCGLQPTALGSWLTLLHLQQHLPHDRNAWLQILIVVRIWICAKMKVEYIQMGLWLPHFPEFSEHHPCQPEYLHRTCWESPYDSSQVVQVA